MTKSEAILFAEDLNGARQGGELGFYAAKQAKMQDDTVWTVIAYDAEAKPWKIIHNREE